MNRFGLDDVQAQAILDMRLKALAGPGPGEAGKRSTRSWRRRSPTSTASCSDDALVRQILKEELTAIADKYGDDRKTEIQDVEDEIDIEDLIEEEQCVFTLTEAGYIKRTPVSEYAAQSKGGMGKKGITTREEDTVVDVFTASTHDYHPVLHRHRQGLPEEGLSDPRVRQDRQGHQPHQHPADRAGRAGADHAPLPGDRATTTCTS